MFFQYNHKLIPRPSTLPVGLLKKKKKLGRQRRRNHHNRKQTNSPSQTWTRKYLHFIHICYSVRLRDQRQNFTQYTIAQSCYITYNISSSQLSHLSVTPVYLSPSTALPYHTTLSPPPTRFHIHYILHNDFLSILQIQVAKRALASRV